MFKAISKFSGSTYATGPTSQEVVALCKAQGVPRNAYSIKAPKKPSVAAWNSRVYVGI